MSSLVDEAVAGPHVPRLADLQERLTCSVEEAGQALNLSRGATYAAVRKGEIPSIRLGHRILIPVPKLLELVGYQPTGPRNAEAGAVAAPDLAAVHVLAKELESSDGAPDPAS